MKNLIRIAKNKQKKLDGAREKMNLFLKKSDDVFKVNIEQWEAFQQCIKQEQKRILKLTKELSILKDSIEKT